MFRSFLYVNGWAGDGRLKAFIWFGPRLVDVSRAARSQFRMPGGIPSPGGEAEGFALFLASDIAPEEIELVGKFLRYLGGVRHDWFLGSSI